MIFARRPLPDSLTGVTRNKPGVGSIIDWDDPVTAGLVLYCPFLDIPRTPANSVRRTKSLVGGGTDALSKTAAALVTASRFLDLGTAISMTGAGNSYMSWTAPLTQQSVVCRLLNANSQPFTVAGKFRATGAGTIQAVMAMLGVTSLWTLGLNASNQAIMDFAGTSTATTVGTYNTGAWFTVFGQNLGVTTATLQAQLTVFNSFGILLEQVTGTAGSYGGGVQNNELGIGGSNATALLTGQVEWVAIWNRNLPSPTMQDLASFPYRVLIPPIPRVRFFQRSIVTKFVVDTLEAVVSEEVIDLATTTAGDLLVLVLTDSPTVDAGGPVEKSASDTLALALGESVVVTLLLTVYEGGPASVDTFTRANETPLTTPWVLATGGEGTINLVSNAVQAADNGHKYYSRGDLTPGPDQYAQVRLVTVPAPPSASDGVVAVRITDGRNGYVAVVSATETIIARNIAGDTLTPIASNAVGWTVNDVCRLEAEGSALRVLKNGSVVLSTTDTSHPAGRVGVFIYWSAASSGSIVDDWAGGALSPFDLSLSESIEVAAGAVDISASDTLVLTVSELVSLINAAGVADVLAVSLTDALTATLATALVAESLTITLAEAAALVASIQAAESLTVTIGDTVTVLTALQASDSLPVALSDAVPVLAVAQAVADAFGITLTEVLGTLTAMTAVADTLDIRLTEALTLLVQLAPVADLLGVTLAETVQVLIGLIEVAVGDTLVLAVSDVVAAVTAVLQTADTLPLSLSEATALFVALGPMLDTLGLALTEATTVLQSLAPVADTLGLTLSEVVQIVAGIVQVTANDTLTVTLGDEVIDLATYAAGDALVLHITPEQVSVDTGDVVFPVSASDILTVRLADAVSQIATDAAVEDLVVTLTEAVISFFRQLNVSDTLTLRLTEAATLLAALAPVADLLNITLSEAVSVISGLTEVTAADTLGLSLSDQVTRLLASVTVEETVAPQLSEAFGLFQATTQLADTLQLTLAEALTVVAALAPVADTLGVRLTEAAQLANTITVSDTLRLGVTEALTLAILTLVTANDTLVVTASEDARFQVTLTVTDPLEVVIEELMTIFATLWTADVLPLGLAEAVSARAFTTLSVSDTVAVVLLDTASYELYLRYVLGDVLIATLRNATPVHTWGVMAGTFPYSLQARTPTHDLELAPA